jgi:hypothetical protein
MRNARALVKASAPPGSSRACHGLRLMVQMNAEKLLISAAMAISMAGVRTSMASDSRAVHVPYLFPICSLFVPYVQ